MPERRGDGFMPSPQQRERPLGMPQAATANRLDRSVDAAVDHVLGPDRAQITLVATSAVTANARNALIGVCLFILLFSLLLSCACR